MSTYEEQKEESQEFGFEDYSIAPSRATLVYDEDTNLASEAPSEENTEDVSPEPDAGLLDGLDLGVLELPPQTEQPPAIDKVNTPEFKKFQKEFQEYIGVDLKDAVAMMTELQTFRAEQRIQKERQELQQAWGIQGEEYENRLSQIQERFRKYKPELQAKLDNVQGAQLIWAKLQQEEQQKRTKNVPTLDRSNTKVSANGNTKVMFTRSQIQKMSADEYAANANKIAYAFANGLVK